MALAGVLYASRIYVRKRIDDVPEDNPIPFLNLPDDFQPALFFLMNVTSLLLYFVFVYNPHGTVEPAWTEWLG